MSSLQFKIAQLRSKNQQTLFEAILILMMALFTSAILPSLLIKYVYAGQALLTAPPLLDYVPTTAFVVSLLFFAYALIANFTRERQIKILAKELEEYQFSESAPMSEKELQELENIVDAALADSTKKTNKAKKTTKSASKSTKKTSKK